MTTRRDALFLPLVAAGAAAPIAAAARPAHTARTSGAVRPPSPHRPVQPYVAACVQTVAVPTFTRDGTFIPEALRANLDRMCAAVRRGRDEVGARLFVFSEFCLQRQVSALTTAQWLPGTIRIPGPEIEALARVAQETRAYIAFNPVEAIPAFPNRYFLSGVLIGPTGRIELNYRKLYDLTNKTRPSDVLTAWLDRFGPDSLFPVADTELGRIAVTIGSDLVWPELVRGFVFRGAEIILNCLGSPNRAPSFVPARAADAVDAHDPIVPVMARRVRAYENLAYVLSTNLGPLTADPAVPLPDMQPSEVIDFTGNLLARSRDNAEQFVAAKLDVEALRRARCTPGPANLLLQLQAELHERDYRQARFAPMEPFGARLPETGAEHEAQQQAEVADLVRRGILVPPAESGR